MIGTGASKAMFGQLNQRLAIRGSINGVHKLTMRIPSTTPTRQRRPQRRAQSCSAPSVLMISQPAPKRP